MKQLQISDSLSLPIDAGTQTFAFIGRKGSGKSYGSGKLVELLISAGIQVAVLDTVGNWYGLRLAADGKSHGIDIPIIGGLRGDLPLEATAGSLIADTLVDSGRSLVIDASQFSKADRQRFAFSFGQQLWKRKKGEHNPTPLMLILEESQLIIPEAVRGDTATMVGIYEEIIRLGRNYGIGVTMITQRPQSVNKEVLNQTECLFVFQVNGAHERKALKDWIVHQGMDVKMLDQLPSLKPGECFVWSPQWLEVLKKIKIGKKNTFDSTSTPRVGGTFRGKDIKPIDLDVLKEKMKATIERAKADDPKELKKRIAELEKLKPKQIDPQIEEKYRNDLQQKDQLIKNLTSEVAHWKDAVKKTKTIIDTVVMTDFFPKGPPPIQPPSRNNMGTPLINRKPTFVISSNGSLSKMERAILQVLAQRQGSKSTRSQIGLLSGYSPQSGSFANALSSLRTKGYIQGPSDSLGITDVGVENVGDYEPYPVGIELQTYWVSKVGKMEGSILQSLIDAHPRELTKTEIGQQTGYSHESGSFANALSKLRTLELIEGFKEIKASDNLF